MTTKQKRAFTAPQDHLRCVAHAISAAGGEGARCMKPRAPGFELCKQHLRVAAKDIRVRKLIKELEGK